MRTDLGVNATPWFMPPEMLASKVSHKVDIWAGGVMAFQLLTGKMPFDDHKNKTEPNILKIWQAIKRQKVPDLPGEVSEEAKDFIHKCLEKDFTKRPTARELLEHPWLTTKYHKAKDRPLGGSVVQRLQRFAMRDPFKRKALSTIAKQLAKAVEEARTEDCSDFDQQLRLAELKSFFSRIKQSDDGSGDEEGGTIDPQQLAQGLRQCGYKIQEDEAKQLMRDRGEMDFSEWAAALIDWEQVKGSNQWDEWARQAFDLIKGQAGGGKEFGRVTEQWSMYEGSFGKFSKALQEDTGHDLNLFPSRASVHGGIGERGGSTVHGTRAIDILEGKERASVSSQNEITRQDSTHRGDDSALRELTRSDE